MSPIISHTSTQPSTPLVDCVVDDMLLQTRPCNNQTALQISNVEYGRAVKALFQDAPDLIVHGIQVRTIRGPQVWGNEVRCRMGQKCDGVASTVCGRVVLLEDECVSGNATNVRQ